MTKSKTAAQPNYFKSVEVKESGNNADASGMM